MFSTPAPQWASASRENGFSYLSWKRKTLLAATVILCGSGLAAQFPNTTASVETSAVTSGSAQTDFENESPSFSQPQNRYADNVQATEERGQIVFAEPAEQFGKYVDPPAIHKDNKSENSPPSQNPPSQRRPVFESIDSSGFEKTALDLPLARWNPLFDQSPPLSVNERFPQPLIDDREIIPAPPETVHLMKADFEPRGNTIIDPSSLVPAKAHTITVVIQEDSIVPATSAPSEK